MSSAEPVSAASPARRRGREPAQRGVPATLRQPSVEQRVVANLRRSCEPVAARTAHDDASPSACDAFAPRAGGSRRRVVRRAHAASAHHDVHFVRCDQWVLAQVAGRLDKRLRAVRRHASPSKGRVAPGRRAARRAASHKVLPCFHDGREARERWDETRRVMGSDRAGNPLLFSAGNLRWILAIARHVIPPRRAL